MASARHAGKSLPQAAPSAYWADMRIDELKTMPGHLIRRAHQISSAIFNAEMLEFELTSVQFIALVAIADHAALDATRVAEMIVVDKATVGGVLERLERKGLIVRRKNPADGRMKVLVATAAGRALITVCFNRVEDLQTRILGPLSAAERETLMRLLAKLVGSDAHTPRPD